MLDRSQQDTGDRVVRLESLEGTGNVTRMVAQVLIPRSAYAPGSVSFIDDNTVAGLENGAVGTFDAYRGAEYANFRTNFDFGRNRDMGSVVIEATEPQLRGSFTFEAVEDGYPRRGDQYRTEISGSFCIDS